MIPAIAPAFPTAAWDSAGLPVEVCYKKTVAFVPIAGSKGRELKTGQGFSRRIHTGQFQNQGSRVRPSRSSAEAVLDPARREGGVQSPGPLAKRRTRQTLRIRSNTIQV